MLENEDCNERHKAEEEVPQRTVVGVCAAAAEKADADGKQAQANGYDNRTGDHRREESAQGLDDEAQTGLKESANQRGTHHRAVGIDASRNTGGNGTGRDAGHHTCGNGFIDADKAGGRTHHDRQSRADRPDGIELQKCDDSRHQHCVLQQGDTQRSESGVRRDAADGHKDHDGREIADKHGQHMLQAKRNGLQQRDPAVQIVCRGVVSEFRFLHNRLLSLSVLCKYAVARNTTAAN